MLKDYNEGLGNYIVDALNVEVVQSKREMAFDTFSKKVAKRQDLAKITLPFASYEMTGDVELDTTRYNAYLHRKGQIVIPDAASATARRATVIRAIPIMHPYTLDFWSPSRDTVENMQRTFWITVMDSPIVHVFHRETNRQYRVSLDVTTSVNEFVLHEEERAGYYNSTISVNLGVWIRLTADVNLIQKAIMQYIQSPENMILDIREYQ